MSDKDQLLAMGFAPERVEWALKATGGRGLQPAMDHILENNDNPVPDLASVGTSSSSAPAAAMDVDEDDDDAAAIRAALGKSGAGASSSGAAGAADAEAKSIKCTECGKIFKNVDLANYHAEKSGHDQFEESTEEIKPLTAEERVQKLEDLRQKMTEKRAKKAAEDAKENRANELLRRKAGQDQTAAKEALKLKELTKDQEAKRREKIEDAKAKAAIRAQIEADKKARAERSAKEKALREGKIWTDAGAVEPTAAPAAAASTSAASGTKGAEYKDTRLQARRPSAYDNGVLYTDLTLSLQIRYTGGAPVSLTLPSESTLQDVAVELVSKSVPIEIDTVTFTMTFPRKQFTRADFSKSLRELGLTPSAVLQIS